MTRLFRAGCGCIFLWAAACPAEAGPPARPVIPRREFNLRDFGAAADGRTWDTAALRRAVAAVDQAGGGTLRVPAGRYLTGPFDLCSNLNLHLDAGAVLLFSQNFGDYRLPDKSFRAMVTATQCHDVMISGSGALDGRGEPWWAIERRVKREARNEGLHDAEIGRPRMVVFDTCQRVLLTGITLENSPRYHFVPTGCQDVTVDGITISSPADSPNTDGIDPSVCRRVLIARCRIDTGDDCIALKAGRAGFGPTEDVLVTDCTFLHGHGCSIGSDTDSGMRNIEVRHCTFDGTEWGVRLKSGRGRGGLVENVTYEDLRMTHVGEAIVISSYYYDLPKPGVHDSAHPVDAHTPIWRDITIRNVTATLGAKDAGLIMGLPEMPASAIRLDRVSIQAPKGLRIGYARDITLRDVSVQVDRGRELIIEDTVSNLNR